MIWTDTMVTATMLRTTRRWPLSSRPIQLPKGYDASTRTSTEYMPNRCRDLQPWNKIKYRGLRFEYSVQVLGTGSWPAPQNGQQTAEALSLCITGIAMYQAATQATTQDPYPWAFLEPSRKLITHLCRGMHDDLHIASHMSCS